MAKLKPIGFTTEVDEIIVRANIEAQRYNHEYVGTEHILLGILREGKSNAAMILRKNGLDLKAAELEVSKLVPRGSDMVTMGKLPQTPRVKAVFEFAREYATSKSSRWINPEHLLYGLLKVRGGVAAQVLSSLGLKPKDIEDFYEKRTYGEILESIIAKGLNIRPHSDGIEIKTSFDLSVGIISRDTTAPSRIYYVLDNTGQIQGALSLRNILEEKGMPYEEMPPRNKVVQFLRRNAETANSLADKIKGE